MAMLEKGTGLLRRAWENLTRVERILIGAAGSFCAVCAAGLLMAYGGVVMQLWLSALCLFGMYWLLRKVGAVSFESDPFKEKTFCTVLLIMAAAGLVIICFLLYYRETVYYYDYLNYYRRQNEMATNFSLNGFMALSKIVRNLMRDDYKVFMSLFIAGPYTFTTRTVESFMICSYLTCMLPVYAGWMLVAKKIGAVLGVRRWGMYYALCGGFLVSWPLLLFPMTHGMPDPFGLAFAALILLLTVDYRFEDLPLPRLLCLFVASCGLILTRRWYMYFVFAYYLCWCAAVLFSRPLRLWPKLLRNMALFGGVSAVLILLPLFPTFYRALTYDYADRYGAFYGGGINENLVVQKGYLGYILLAVLVVGAVVCLAHRGSHPWMPVLAGTWGVSFWMFASVQSFGIHQTLLLEPVYLVFIFAALAGVCMLHRQIAARFAAGVCSMLIGAQFLLAAPRNTVGGVFGNTPLDLSRRQDMAQIDEMVDYILEVYQPGDKVYINATNDYCAQVFSASRMPNDLEWLIQYEASIPSTHGLPTAILGSTWLYVPNKPMSADLNDRINNTMGQGDALSAHFEAQRTFDFPNGLTFTAYKRVQPADSEELAFLLSLFPDWDERWPDMFSEVAAGYAAEKGWDW